MAKPPQNAPKFPGDNLEWDEFLPDLFKKISLRISSHFQFHTKQLGITAEEWRVLSSLFTGRPQRATVLSKHSAVGPSTLSHVLKRMLDDGLLFRLETSGDARVIELDLTTKGRGIVEKLMPIALSCEEIAFRDIAPEAIVPRSR